MKKKKTKGSRGDAKKSPAPIACKIPRWLKKVRGGVLDKGGGRPERARRNWRESVR